MIIYTVLSSVIRMSFTDIKEREKEEKRNAIVDAAEKLFFSKGFDSVTMGDIAKEVGVNRATLYLYFEDKEEIFFAIVLRATRIMNSMFKEGASNAATGLEKIEAVGDAYLAFFQKHPDYYRLLEYSNSQRFNAPCCNSIGEIDTLSRELITIMCDAIKTGITDGTIRKDVEPLQTAIFFASASESLVNVNPNFQNVMESMGISHQKYVRHSMKLLSNAIARKSGAKP